MKAFCETFGVPEKRGIRIASELITDIYTDCMCQKCGIHPLELESLQLLHKNERQYSDTELSFLYYFLGRITVDETLWRLVARYVIPGIHKDYNIEKLELLLNEVVAEMRAPMN